MSCIIRKITIQEETAVEQKIDITDFITLIDSNSYDGGSFITQHSKELYEIIAELASNLNLLNNLMSLKIEHPERLAEIIVKIASNPDLLKLFIDTPDKLVLVLILSDQKKIQKTFLVNFINLGLENNEAFNSLEKILIKLDDLDSKNCTKEERRGMKRIISGIKGKIKDSISAIRDEHKFWGNIFPRPRLLRLFIENVSDSIEAIEMYPEHAEKIKNSILISALEGHCIKDIRDVEIAIEMFPEHAEKIKSIFRKFIESALVEEKKSWRFLRKRALEYNFLIKVTTLYPDLKDKILEMVLTKSFLFEKYFHGENIEDAMANIPEYAERIQSTFIKFIESALVEKENSPSFSYLIPDPESLIKVTTQFPYLKDKILEKAFSGSSVFCCLTRDNESLVKLTTQYPYFKDKILEKAFSGSYVFYSDLYNSDPHNLKTLKETIRIFPEYTVILNLNFKIFAANRNYVHEDISNIHQSIEDAIINRTITHKTLQLCFTFVDILLKESVFFQRSDSEIKTYEELKNLHTYLSKVKFPSLVQLCANSLKQSGIIAKESDHSLQIHLIRDEKDLEKELEKLRDNEEINIMKNHKIILIKILKTDEWYVMGMNHKRELTTEGPIPGNSELGKALLNTKIPVSEIQKPILLKEASKYLKTNLEELKLDLESKNRNMFEDDKPESINYNLSKSNGM